MKAQIKYRSGYKYQLAQQYCLRLKILPNKSIHTDWISLDKYGWLTIKAGYAWDGPSGPTFDTKNFMRGSLVHDALYQLIRMNLLPQSTRGAIDKLLRAHCLEDGMWRVRAWLIFRGVDLGGKSSADPKNAKEVSSAP